MELDVKSQLTDKKRVSKVIGYIVILSPLMAANRFVQS